jgi:hypothetical protein
MPNLILDFQGFDFFEGIGNDLRKFHSRIVE